MGVLWDLPVTRVAVDLSGVHMGLALTSLTGLQTLDIRCAIFLLLWLRGWVYCCICLRKGLIFEMLGAVGRMGVVWDLPVTRVAGNGFGATGGEHIGLALRFLTGLQTLNLSST
jgi:hypothetical protein